MTCIVGLVDKNRIWIGGDSFCSNNSTGHQLGFSKVFQKGDFIFGCSGSPRQQLILMSSEFKPEAKLPDQSNLEYVSITVVNHIKDLFFKHGCVRIKDTQTYEQDSFIIIGYGDQLFELETNFQTLNYKQDYISTGSGYQVALGALHSMKDMRLKPELRILKALEAAAHHTLHVRPPFDLVSMKVKP